MPPPRFKGTETARDIVKAALDEFSLDQARIRFYNGIPYLHVYLDSIDAKLRVDRLLLNIFAECEGICDRYIAERVLEPQNRDKIIRYLAFSAMEGVLSMLAVSQSKILREALEDGAFVTPAMLLNSITNHRATPENIQALKRGLRLTVKNNLKTRLSVAEKEKREFLTSFLNTMSHVEIPVGKGRPPGTTKPKEKRAQEKAQFEAKIEATIRDLCDSAGAIPTKTAVGESLSSGPNAFRIFLAKLKRLEIDYEAIVKRVKRSLNNSS